MNSSRTLNTVLSKRGSLLVFGAASVLLLSACGASVPLDAAQQSAIQSAEPASTSQAITDQLQSGTDVGDIPPLGAALSGGNEATVAELDPDEIVSCTAPAEHIELRTIRLINEARSQARSCGTQSFEATGPVSWNYQLVEAADAHSADMTQHNFFDHTGSDGSTVATRVEATGYEWSRVGENIAAGQQSAAEVVAGWLNSPGHCRNLMSPAFTEVAVTCAEDSGADYSTYWTNVLATPL